MTYHLITGGTGLLGVYLLRDCIRLGMRVAVVVRPSRFAAAQERVDDLMLRWDKQAGYALPRPVVFAGDITKPMLGLAPDEIEWVKRHCSTMVHSAASLTFVATPKDGEPHRSNIEGTRNVLQLCQATGIRKFHHVSTAYICGLRNGLVLETEMDEGQQLGNAYEETKLASEKMVREADFLDPPTVYRPGIITGDSRTGYTTTYHGFYAPLKIAAAMNSRVNYEGSTAPRLIEVLGLNGSDRKNFVPVEWISAVMAHILHHPEHHAKTYHLTPANTTSVDDCYRIMRDVIENPVATQKEAPPAELTRDDFEKTFHEQMLIYKSYWRDDPTFDTTNTRAAAPHLPCPIVDESMLLRLCQAALAANFGWPKTMPIKPKLDVATHLAARLPLSCVAADSTATQPIGLQVNGAGGGQWTLHVQGDRVVEITPGIASQASVLFYMNSTIYRRLSAGELSVDQAIRTGQVFLDGNEIPVAPLAEILAQTVGIAAENEPNPTRASARQTTPS